MNLNKVVLLGTVSDDPVLKETKTSNVCNLKVLTEKHITKKSGDEVTINAWHRVTLWGQMAKDAAELQKDQPVYIEGELQYGSYENKEGQKVYTTDINVGFDGKLVCFPSGAVETTEDQGDAGPFA